VLCNGGCNTIYSLILVYLQVPLDRSVDPTHDPVSSFLLLANMCSFACCNGDTWASEIGPVASKTNPRLITTWREVPKGTNGGVSLWGTVASGAGGLVIGCAFGLCCFFVETQTSPTSFGFIHFSLLGLMSGLLGSALDSLLGATLQYSGFNKETNRVVSNPGPTTQHISGLQILDNHQVNLLSSLLCGLFMSTFVIFCPLKINTFLSC
jgi:uncharacterized membrane protein